MPSRNAKNRRSRNKKARTQPKKVKLLSSVSSPLAGNRCCISDAATNYLKCVIDPAGGPLVGVPDGSIVLTRKVRTWCRGTFGCSASGSPDACVLFNPYGLLFSDPYCVYAGQPSSMATLNTPGAGGFIAHSSNAPYSTASLTNAFALQGRLVSAKLRIRYIGTELNKGGTILGVQEPNHSSLAGKTVNNLLAYPSGKRISINQMKNGEFFELNYFPSDVNDNYFINSFTGTTAYDGQYFSDGVLVGDGLKPFIGVYISNPVAQANFEFDAWGVVEYAGPNVTPKTVTIPDTQGYHSVLAALSAVVEKSEAIPEMAQSGSTSSPTFLNRVFAVANNLVSGAMPHVMEMGSRYGPSVAAAAARGALNWVGGTRATPSPRITFPSRFDNYLEPI